LREARIAGEVKSNRSVGIYRASDTTDKPILAELIASTFVEVLSVAIPHSERKERFPTQTGAELNSG